MSRILICMGFLIAATAAADAQGKKGSGLEARFHRVHLRNGNVVDGRLIRFTPSGILLNMKFGQMEIRNDLIKRTEDGKLYIEFVKVRTAGEQHKVEEQPERRPDPSARRDPFKPVDVPKPKDVEPTVVSTETQAQVDAILTRMSRANEELRVELVQELMKMGEDAAIYIAQILDQIPPAIRSEAAEALSGIKSPKAMPALVDLLKHEDARVRTQALNAIGGMKNPRHAQYLRPMLKDSDAIVRGSAVLMLERMDDKSSFEAITVLATDAEKAVRSQVLTSLFNLAKKFELEKRLYSILQSRVRSGRGAVRADLVAAMGRLKIDEGWDEMAAFLRDPSPMVRQQAAIALSRLNAPESGEEIVDRLEVERDRWTLIHLMNCVRQFRLKEAIPGLINQLRSTEKDIQKAASSTLQLLTNKNLGVDADAWSEWYEKVRTDR